MSERLRAAIERRLLRLWFGDPRAAGNRGLSLLLAPLQALVRRAAIARRRAIETAVPPARPRVVVVGNLVVGGTGKTPATIALARALSARGWRVGLLASGYRARRTEARLVPADGDPDELGDEAILLAAATALPVAAGRRRDEALRLLCGHHPELDVVLSDDGLQHPHLPRHLEIAVFDDRGAGNGRLLPAGPLREPLEHAGRMHALLLNGQARAPLPGPPAFRFGVEPAGLRALRDGRALDAAAFVREAGGRRVAAIAGIAQPRRFFDALRTLGIGADERALPDHARIDAATLAAIDAPLVVMTSKDAVKCRRFADARCWALEVEARLDPAFVDWLEERLRGHPTA